MTLKLALFNLQKYVKEEEFASDFLLRGGVKLVVGLLEKKDKGLTGNSLAVSISLAVYQPFAEVLQYALQGICGILELDAGWGELSDTFIDRILLLLVSSSQPNILRPATAIIQKLVLSSPQLDNESTPLKTPKARSKGKVKELISTPDTVLRYGFERVYTRMEAIGRDEASGVKGAASILGVVVRRLEGTGDLELVAGR